MEYNGPSEDFTNLTEIRLGWFGPSDPADPVHGDFWWAADLAVREANETRASAVPGSFDALPIRLVPRWAPDPWRAGVSLLTRMVYDEPPLALIGSIDSASTHLAEQVVAKANLPLVSPIATDKTATLAGVSWMFSCIPDDTAVAHALVADLLADRSVGAALRRDQKNEMPEPSRDKPAPTTEPTSTVGAALRRDPVPATAERSRDERAPTTGAVSIAGGSVGGRLGEASLPQASRATPEIGLSRGKPAPTAEPTPVGTPNRQSAIQNPRSSILLLCTTDHGSRMAAHEIASELSRHGIAPAFRLDLPPGVANADEALQRCDPRAAAVIVLADASDSARLTRAVRERMGPVRVFGRQTMGQNRFLELAGPAAEGVRFPLLFAPAAQEAAAARFIKQFVAERNHAPDYTAALAYDATRLLIAAVHHAGPNRARIRTALVQLSPWSGIAGPIVFDGTGQNHRADVRLGTIRQGARVADAPIGAVAPSSLP